MTAVALMVDDEHAADVEVDAELLAALPAACIEGGLAGWRISLNLVSPRLKMVALKDFYWAKRKDGKWDVRWCPMGEGMVDWQRVFAAFAAAKFSGPLTLHVEYETHDELAALAKDYAFIRGIVNTAYGPPVGK